jgi:acyl carrier protein phosphodiesterase
MNFLFHMALSGDDPQLLVGNFMGDFVKGPLEDRFSPGIRRGVLLHRRIDSHAETDPFFRASRQRLDPLYGLYRGVLVDLFYDYFLVNSWHQWCDEPLDAYLTRTRRIIEAHRGSLPPAMHRLVPVIFEELLPSYGSVAGIATALARISRRVQRPNPLAGGESELLRHHDGLSADFQAFTPGMFHYVSRLIADSNR